MTNQRRNWTREETIVALNMFCTIPFNECSARHPLIRETAALIVVKNDGDVVAFHSTIADEFKDFLVAKMLMEGPSHSRHKDMTIFKEGDKYYLKLGLQLRFSLNR